MREPQPPFVSVKFDAVGRPHRFLLPEIDFEPPLRAGEQVVVTRGEHLAYGTVARSVPQLAARRAPAVTSTSRVLRRVSTQDVTARLTQQHREREANRVCGMKIKERGLAMKLVKVEHALDGPRLVFYFTAEARVDFRELVRELASQFHCRIDMRQSVRATRPSCWADMAPADVPSVARRGCSGSSPSRSRWPSGNTCA